MLAKPKEPRIALPKGWQSCVRSAVLHAIALAHYAIVYARAWAADSINTQLRLSAEDDRLPEECALLRKELCIKDARTAQITPHGRPHYLVGSRAGAVALDPTKLRKYSLLSK